MIGVEMRYVEAGLWAKLSSWGGHSEQLFAPCLHGVIKADFLVETSFIIRLSKIGVWTRAAVMLGKYGGDGSCKRALVCERAIQVDNFVVSGGNFCDTSVDMGITGLGAVVKVGEECASGHLIHELCV